MKLYCNKCKQHKDDECFGVNSRNKGRMFRHSYCKDCVKIAQKKRKPQIRPPKNTEEELTKMSMREVGEALALSRETIRKEEINAINKIRLAFASMGIQSINDFYDL